MENFSYLYSQTSHFHANNISFFFHLCSDFIFYLFVLAPECLFHVCSICLMPYSYEPISVSMTWIESMIYLLWLAIYICFAYKSGSIIRFLHTSTFYKPSERQWSKDLSIWVCLCMFWMSEFLLIHPTWSILPIIKKILKLPCIF